MQSAAYVSVKKDSYRRALECNSVPRYSYLALLEFKLGGWLDLESTNEHLPLVLHPSPPPITTKGEDVRLRDARRQPRLLFIEYLYTIQLSFKGWRGEGGRTKGGR